MIIPMIDIIFFLLVFFMLSTLHMVEQKGLTVNLPQAAARQEVQAPIAITLDSAGDIYLEQEKVQLAGLTQKVQGELAKKPQAVVVLRSDAKTEHGKVVAVLDTLKGAGVQRLAIATQAKTR